MMLRNGDVIRHGPHRAIHIIGHLSENLFLSVTTFLPAPDYILYLFIDFYTQLYVDNWTLLHVNSASLDVGLPL